MESNGHHRWPLGRREPRHLRRRPAAIETPSGPQRLPAGHDSLISGWCVRDLNTFADRGRGRAGLRAEMPAWNSLIEEGWITNEEVHVADDGFALPFRVLALPLGE